MTEHTIVNIRAHDSEVDDEALSGNQAQNKSFDKVRQRGPSSRVEYHSDRDRMSKATDSNRHSRKFAQDNNDHYFKQEKTSPSQQRIMTEDAIVLKAEIGV